MDSLTAANGKAALAPLAQDVQHLRWIPRAAITADDAHSVLTGSRILSGGRPYAILVDMTDIIDLPPDARAVFNTETLVVAAALLGEGPMDEVLAAGACKAVHPTQFFVSEQDAVAWLRECVAGISAGSELPRPR